MSEPTVDQGARDMAIATRELINIHIQVCNERANHTTQWRADLSKRLEAIEAAIQRNAEAGVNGRRTIYWQIWGMMAALVVALISAIVTMQMPS